jgi:broad specificity phosphatase PhoE
MKAIPGTNEPKPVFFQRAIKFKQKVWATLHPILCVTHSMMIHALMSNQILENGKFDFEDQPVHQSSLHYLRI